jgi:hypothetical protein
MRTAARGWCQLWVVMQAGDGGDANDGEGALDCHSLDDNARVCAW